ncbi:MAG: ADP-glyceromanno-heptose 6-epimerase [Acidobacteriaceae bacterium]|nr:ADP-glyceromanno-heptose 6-epimerase [Acidobacteriaceae bacterium]
MTDLAKGRILVTGGAGFIGSALVWELNRRGLKNILICDILGSDEKWKNLVPLQFADYVEADALRHQIESGSKSLNDITTIFHLGACTSTTETDASYLIRNNFEYTKMLAHFALDRHRRFVYASSAATYGAIAAALPETATLESLRPLNMYGYSKHLFDSYAERAGILPRITGLKYFNVYGPNEYHKGDMRSVVIKAFYQVQETGCIKLFKSYRPEFRNGEQRRDFLYVKDAVGATLFLAEHVDGGGLYNVGSGEPHTWKDLARAIFSGLAREPHIEYIDMPESLRPKYQYFTCAHIDKLRSAGFKHQFHSLDAGVCEYVTHYLIHGRHLGEEEYRK